MSSPDRGSKSDSPSQGEGDCDDPVYFINILERATGMDLDRDGDIGVDGIVEQEIYLGREVSCAYVTAYAARSCLSIVAESSFSHHTVFENAVGEHVASSQYCHPLLDDTAMMLLSCAPCLSSWTHCHRCVGALSEVKRWSMAAISCAAPASDACDCGSR
jgi:hypothetical protein